MKKSLPIESLIRWAYRDELPKEQTATSFLRPDSYATPWDGITKTGMLGADVQEPDVRNRYGLVPDFTAQSAPHADAVRVYNAVRDLGQLHFDLPDDWNPLTDLGDLGGDGLASIAAARRSLCIIDGDGVPHLRDVHGPVYLVQKAAVMDPPEWQCEQPIRKVVKQQDGRTRWFIKTSIAGADGDSYIIEVDGFDHSKRLPKTGAYKKEYLDPDPARAAVCRGEHEIWVAALGFLVETLTGALDEYEPLPSAIPARPWETGMPPAPRILIDGRPVRQIIHEPRPLAGPPPYRGIERKDEGKSGRDAA